MKEIKKGEIEITNKEELNKELSKIIKDPSINKPSEEEINIAKLEFENEAKSFSQKLWKIGSPNNVNEVYNYIVHFMDNRFIWHKDAWMGVIKLKEEIDAASIVCTKEKGLEIGYQALEFIYYMLTNPGGKGLPDALNFESENEIYIKVLTYVSESLESARKTLKNIEFLQQRWGAMSQGFYLEEEQLPLEEDIDENNVEEISEEELKS